MSSRPFDVVASGEWGRLRVGIEIPSGTNMRFVGTSIDCSAEQQGGGLFRVVLSVSDTALASKVGEQPLSAGSFTTFSMSTTLYMREAQPLQFTVGTDPISGETTRAEVTITPVK